MKILQVITRSELGGGQRHVLDLLEGLRDSYQIELAVGEAGYLVDKARALNIPVHIVPHLKMPMDPRQDLRALLELDRLIAVRKPDLVHTHTSKAGILGRFAAAHNGVPCVFTAHTWCFSEGTSWKWKLIGIPLERLAAKMSGAIINVSEANRRLAVQYKVAPAGQLMTIHNGIADTGWRATPGAGGVPLIVMVARFAPQKAQAGLLRAVQGIAEPLRVCFVGDGPTRAAHEALARSLGVQDRVEFAGERHEIAEILAKAHIFALPTNWEGFPLTILEGMRAGLPVVASNVGGVSEAVLHGETGYLVGPGDAQDFQARLRELVRDGDLRARLGKAGRARYEREFTVPTMLEKTVAVYMSLKADRSPAVWSPARA